MKRDVSVRSAQGRNSEAAAVRFSLLMLLRVRRCRSLWRAPLMREQLTELVGRPPGGQLAEDIGEIG